MGGWVLFINKVPYIACVFACHFHANELLPYSNSNYGHYYSINDSIWGALKVFLGLTMKAARRGFLFGLEIR